MIFWNGVPVHYTLFRGGELQVDLPCEVTSRVANLIWLPGDANDILALGLTVDALRRNGRGVKDIYLEILYLPYARQDRVCRPGQALSLDVIGEILSSMRFHDIVIYDAHNQDAVSGIFAVPSLTFISAALIIEDDRILDKFGEDLVLCAPDHGAKSRTHEVFLKSKAKEMIVLDKIRDPDTGKVNKISISARCEASVCGQNIFIVDDICDVGTTFLLAHEVLRKAGAKSVHLYVTHGVTRDDEHFEKLVNTYDSITMHHIVPHKGIDSLIEKINGKYSHKVNLIRKDLYSGH